MIETRSLLESISIVGMGLVILGGNINAEDFFGLTFVHSSTLCNSLFILSRKIDGLAAWITKHAPSATNLGVVFKALDMSFLYIKTQQGA